MTFRTIRLPVGERSLRRLYDREPAEVVIPDIATDIDSTEQDELSSVIGTCPACAHWNNPESDAQVGQDFGQLYCTRCGTVWRRSYVKAPPSNEIH